MKSVLILDIGTGGIHVSLMNSNGIFLCQCYDELEYDESDNGLTIDTASLWEKTRELIKQVTSSSRFVAKDLVAISVTGQRQGIVFLDKNDEVLYAGPNIDKRATKESESISKKMCIEIYKKTGHWPSGKFALLRLEWFRKNKPEVYQKINSLLLINSWIVFKLTGQKRSEYTNAAETLLFDIHNFTWSEELCDMFLIDKALLPEVISPGSIVGSINSNFSKDLNLKKDLDVVLAPADTQCAVLGMGIMVPGAIAVVCGSTTPVQTVVNNPIIDNQRRIWTCPYVKKNTWILESNGYKSGIVYRRLKRDLNEFLRHFSNDININYDDMEKIALENINDTKGIVSFLGPKISNVSKSQKDTGAIILLNENINLFKALVPSFIENLAFAIKANIDQLAQLCRLSLPNVFLTGRLSRDKLLLRILSDICEEEIYITSDTETTSRGAAVAAFIAVEEFSSFSKAISKMVPHPQKINKKDEINNFNEAFRLWKYWFDILSH